MRNFTQLSSIISAPTSKLVLTLLLALSATGMFSQVRVPFTQRTSQYTPTKKIYNIQGDFTMIGNTNLTLVNYGDNTNNSNNDMQYVDVDSDNNTFNSSSATLNFSTENGAVPNCSKIIYAGLYWSARASNSSSSPDTFSVTKNVPGPPQAVNNNQTVGHNNTVTNTQYSMNVSRQGNNNSYYVRYEFTGNGDNVQFEFQNSAPYIRYRVNSGSWVNPTNQVVSNSGNTRVVTFDPVTVYTESGGITLTVNGLERDSRQNRSTSEYQSTSFAYTNVSGTIATTVSVTKNFNKRQVLLQGPGASGYTPVTANTNDIYYPNSSDDFIYSAYAEVTDYVKQYGLGAYTVADVAMVEGNGGSVGYYGGWGLIVIYENSKMKWRDVTVFDGHAYVSGSNTTSFELPVSGFNTAQTGPINLKLGLMAGEGDRGISGDYFSIQKQSDNSWLDLNHSGNSTTNFFNSSILTGGNTRNPNLLNNTGLDISMFTIPNASNSVITNNQTSTKFRYGTTQDTYSIFTIAMSVDAYIPQPQGISSVTTINGNPASLPLTAQPGQEIVYKIKVLNEGSEAINNATLEIPVPFTASYVNGSASGAVFFSPAPTPNAVSFNPSQGANGTIIWNIGTLPLPANPSDVLGEFTFKLKATEDCSILKNTHCNPAITIYGYINGVGAISGVAVSTKPFIQGYTASGICQGEPIKDPLTVNINAQDYITNHCQNTPDEIVFNFCNTSGSIAVSQISGAFPPGTRFYNSYPVGPNTVEYTATNPFPATVGTQTYYGIPPGSNDCYYTFKISISASPVLTAPANYTLEGCSTAAITGLVYSETPVSISLAQFLAAGGTTTNQSLNYTISYVDTKSGTCPIVVTRKFTISSPCSSNQIFTQQITIKDTTPPVAPAPPAAVTVACGNNVPAMISLTANDNCSGAITVQGQDVTTPGNCPNSYTIVRTWTFTDACGNTSSVSQNITVNDNVAPVVPTAPAAVTVACSNNIPAMISLTANDNCSGAITVQGQDVTTPGNCPNSYTIVRTWTFTDACGNTSSVSQNITVNDNVAPVVPTAPAAVTVACSNNIPAMISLTANDNCSGAITVQGQDATTPGNCPNSYTIVRTWTFTDACGNTSSVSQNINVNDNIAPVVPTAPADVTVSCGGDVPAMISLTANDNCSGAITVQGQDATTPGNCPNSYTIVRTWTFTDACGNTSSVSQNINVNDNVAPTFTAPADITIYADANCNYNASVATTGDVTNENDNCSTGLQATYTDAVADGNCAGSKIITRTWTLVDQCGNTTTHAQTITVLDNTPPMITTQAQNVTVTCDGQGNQTQLQNWLNTNGGAVASDNCGPVKWSNNFSTLGNNCSDSVTVIFTATDACNNTSTTQATFTVNDNVPPVAPTPPAAVTVSCGGDVPAMISLTANDNCSGAITVQGQDATTPGNCPNSYTIVRTWTFTDACGNTSSVSQNINVNDNVAPVVPTAPAAITVSCGGDVPEMISLTANDNCSGAITVQGQDATTPGNCPNSYTIVRTWTFTDACGNTSSVSQNINVNDNIAPVVPTAPADVTVSCGGDVPAMISLTANDNCSGAITVQGQDVTTQGNCPNSYTIVRTWTFTDACGNTSSVSQNINVNDNVAPVVPTAPAAITVSCGGDVPEMISLTANDNCSGAITVQGQDATTPGNCPNSYTIVRTWTFTDACGNTSSVSQNINVNDNIAPVVPTAPADVTVSCGGDVPAMISLTANDNCSGAITVQGQDVTTQGNCPNSYTIVRTWTFTDACGNTSSVSQNINVNDNVAPVVPTAPAAITVSCGGDVPEMISLTANDNCSGAITVQGQDATTPGNCPNSYTIVRTWTFTDACGNTSSVSQNINVNDNIAPVVPTAPADVTVSCGGDVPAMISLTANDNCSGAITVQGQDATTPGNCPNSYTIVRTWTFTDACGNTSSVSQNINVNDNVAPTFTAPADITIYADANCNYNASVATTGDVTNENDNCSTGLQATYTDAVADGNCAGSKIITRTWTLVDQCGNTTTHTQTITVLDNTPPMITTQAQNVTVTCDGQGNQTQLQNWLNTNGGAVASDNCGPVKWSNNFSTLGNNCSDSVTVIFTATDACNNTSTTQATFTVNDNVPPVAPTPPAAVTVSCGGDVPAMISLTANDNCSGAITVQGQDATTPGNCPNSYTIVRTWTFTDACGNTSSVSQNINVNDNVAPVVPTAPAAITVSCGGDVPEMISLTANDNCSGAITVQGQDVTTQGNCPNSYTIVRTWTFTDACGNTSSVSQNINVNDNIAPVVPTAPAAITVSCGGDVPAMISLTANDNCSGAITVQGQDATTPGNCPNSYTIVRTWTFTDACGNTSSVSQNINVNDNIAPVVPTAPADVTVSCSGEVPAMISLTANDNCSGEITVQGQDVTTQGNCPNSYTIVRTWTFTDACGNTSSVSQNINVNDNIAPVVPTAPAAITVSCGGDVPAMISLTANDNCSGAITVQGQDVTTQGNCPNSYTIVRTWTFTDACGNTSSVSQNINVNDNIAPVVPTAPADVTVSCGGDVPAMISLTANDNCSGEITVQGQDATTPSNCPNSYTIVRTWTFTDACGNTSSVSQNINVNDNIAPVVPTAPADVTVSCGGDVPAMISLTANDNCSGEITVQGQDVTTQGNCPNSYTIVRTWTFTDTCGNTSSVSQNINVNDNIAPVVPTAPADVTVSCSGEVPAMISLTANDNCSGEITVQGQDVTTQGNCPNSYTIVRTWTFTDTCGNTSSVSQNINVNDNVAPVVPTAPADVTVSCGGDVPAMISLTANDNCSGEITVQGQDVTTQGNCPNSYTIVRTWTFTDACGNTSSVSQNINVNDNVAPVVPTAPAAITVSCGGEVPAMISLTANDNCSGEITVQGQDVTTQGNCPNSYTIVRTWTFTDACGNTSSISQNINVNDNVAPVVPTAPADVTVSCGGEVPAMISLTANDNCSGEITVQGQDVTTQGNCPNSYTIVRTWTFTDACGNTSSVSQNINVNDNIAPVVPTAPADVTVSCGGEVPAMISLTANDNCSGEITVQGQDVTAQGNCPNSYIITRTWTFTDACGNTANSIQLITVSDDIAPSLTSTLDAEVNANCADIPPVPEPTFTDNCGSTVTVDYSENITNQTSEAYDIIRSWTVSDTCFNQQTYTQTVHVTISNPLTVIAKAICIKDEPVNLFSVLPEGTPQNGTWSTPNAGAALEGSIFTAGQLTPGNYIVRYTLTEGDCPRIFEINIEVHERCIVLPACSINVYNAVSPNDDGYNDVFFIDGITCYPQNNVEIYNRWGILVFSTDGYDNTTRVFRGVSEGRATFNKGAELPDGTYFYILKYKDESGTEFTKTGYLYLNR
ncbi:HYR-like domain-containing protein [Flavobacterium cerinum]|uniref:Gliding motility-associated C-terminal domain-containing protein n=1 Tax=Flavobacterium cerinum TaxID=2502784 RepID=A0ABY5INS9_9FLAO|nr:gliding motility-associated C-terminal domain-containing protein [Flavobacterium cerinum]UUC44502.1 gliding motility-associated C-terminal domain-containing protein [Flavobacterium cerinum]